MSEFTLEKFEQILDHKLENFVTEKRFEQILDKKLDEKLDSKLSGLVTKEYLSQALEKQTRELKEFAVGQTEELARMIATTVANPLQEHLDEYQSNVNLKHEVVNLKRDMAKIKTTLHLK